jgi:hypothetical protein
MNRKQSEWKYIRIWLRYCQSWIISGSGPGKWNSWHLAGPLVAIPWSMFATLSCSDLRHNKWFLHRSTLCSTSFPGGCGTVGIRWKKFITADSFVWKTDPGSRKSYYVSGVGTLLYCRWLYVFSMYTYSVATQWMLVLSIYKIHTTTSISIILFDWLIRLH